MITVTITTGYYLFLFSRVSLSEEKTSGSSVAPSSGLLTTRDVDITSSATGMSPSITFLLSSAGFGRPESACCCCDASDSSSHGSAVTGSELAAAGRAVAPGAGRHATRSTAVEMSSHRNMNGDMVSAGGPVSGSVWSCRGNGVRARDGIAGKTL